MALVRILVDGYSLLHAWPELAPGKSRHSPAARDELIQVLIRYQDACGTPVTVIFDGAGSKRAVAEPASTDAIEILYSHAGQTADQMIERAAHLFQAYGEVLVVTNDFAERDIVSGVGGMTSNCDNFIHTLRSALNESDGAVRLHNEKERARFRAH